MARKSIFNPRFMMWNPETGESKEPLTEKQWEKLISEGYEWAYDIEVE